VVIRLVDLEVATADRCATRRRHAATEVGLQGTRVTVLGGDGQTRHRGDRESQAGDALVGELADGVVDVHAVAARNGTVPLNVHVRPQVANATTDVRDNGDRHGREPLRQLEVIEHVRHDAVLRHFAAEVAEGAGGRAAGAATRETTHAVQVVVAVAALDFSAETIAEAIADGQNADEAFIEVRVALAAGARRVEIGGIAALRRQVVLAVMVPAGAGAQVHALDGLGSGRRHPGGLSHRHAGQGDDGGCCEQQMTEFHDLFPQQPSVRAKEEPGLHAPVALFRLNEDRCGKKATIMNGT
jgi:hypothetical protein